MGRIRATAVLHKSCLFVLCFLASELSCAQAGRSGTSDNSIDLRDVSSLTFRSGQMTKGRRAAPVPQLACTGGKACGTHSYMVDVVQCRNVGEDDMGSVQWECHADLEDTVRFGSINVNCEGFAHSQDVMKLRGSCGLEYSLQYTEKYNRNQNARHDSGGYHDDYSSSSNSNRRSSDRFSNHYNRSSDSEGWGGTIFFLGLLAVLIIVVMRERAASSNSNSNSTRPPPYNPNAGPGQAPPPPYSQVPIALPARAVRWTVLMTVM
eukprot:2186923-Rhodomonas_salina.1